MIGKAAATIAILYGLSSLGSAAYKNLREPLAAEVRDLRETISALELKLDEAHEEEFFEYVQTQLQTKEEELQQITATEAYQKHKEHVYRDFERGLYAILLTALISGGTLAKREFTESRRQRSRETQ